MKVITDLKADTITSIVKNDVSVDSELNELPRGKPARYQKS